jgi:DNA-binding transcriptional LysR family regulator
MRWIACILFLIFLCGCSTLPGSSAVQRRFLSEHPGVTILSVTSNDAVAHYHDTTQGHADFSFVYRNADGTEHEEVWHYELSKHSWHLVKKQQIR